MSDQRLTKLQQHIESLRKRVTFAEQIEQAIESDPSLLDVLGDMLALEPGKSGSNGKPPSMPKRPITPKPKVGGGKMAAAHFKKVAEYLESTGNEPRGIPDIAAAVDLKPAAVIQLAYRSHKAVFEALPVPGHATRKQWRLKPGWQEVVKASEE